MRSYAKQTALKYAIILTITFISCIGCGKEKFPPSAFEIGHIDLGPAYDLYLEGNYAYVSCNSGMAIIDITDLRNPEHITTVSTSEASLGILVENDIVFSGSAGESNFKIIDVTNKNNPDIISMLTIPGSINGFSKNGNTLFLSTWTGELYILNVSNLSSPEIISSINCQGNGSSLAYHNNTIYFANGQRGLQVIDVSDLNSPLMNPNVVTYTPWDIFINSGFLYLGQQNQGFSIFEIEANNSLSLLSSKNNEGETWGISQEGDRLYIGDLQQGVEI